MSWCVGESKTSIQLDYGEKKEKLGLKYGELSNKYRVQDVPTCCVEGRYEIEISLTGDGTIKQLPLNLVKDS